MRKRRSMEFHITQFSDTASYNRALSQCRRQREDRKVCPVQPFDGRKKEAWRWSLPASWSAADRALNGHQARRGTRGAMGPGSVVESSLLRPECAGHFAPEALGAGGKRRKSEKRNHRGEVSALNRGLGSRDPAELPGAPALRRDGGPGPVCSRRSSAELLPSALKGLAGGGQRHWPAARGLRGPS